MGETPNTTVAAGLDIPAGSALGREMQDRAGIFEMTRAAEAAVLTPAEAGGLSHDLRHALAARIAAIHAEPALAARLAASVGDAALRALAAPGTPAAEPRVQAMVGFTDAVTARPRDVAAADVSALTAAGIPDDDIVRLAELNAFMAYQLRLVAGLRLLAEAAP